MAVEDSFENTKKNLDNKPDSLTEDIDFYKDKISFVLIGRNLDQYKFKTRCVNVVVKRYNSDYDYLKQGIYDINIMKIPFIYNSTKERIEWFEKQDDWNNIIGSLIKKQIEYDLKEKIRLIDLKLTQIEKEYKKNKILLMQEKACIENYSKTLDQAVLCGSSPLGREYNKILIQTIKKHTVKSQMINHHHHILKKKIIALKEEKKIRLINKKAYYKQSEKEKEAYIQKEIDIIQRLLFPFFLKNKGTKEKTKNITKNILYFFNKK